MKLDDGTWTNNGIAIDAESIRILLTELCDVNIIPNCCCPEA